MSDFKIVMPKTTYFILNRIILNRKILFSAAKVQLFFETCKQIRVFLYFEGTDTLRLFVFGPVPLSFHTPVGLLSIPYQSVSAPSSFQPKQTEMTGKYIEK